MFGRIQFLLNETDIWRAAESFPELRFSMVFKPYRNDGFQGVNYLFESFDIQIGQARFDRQHAATDIHAHPLGMITSLVASTPPIGMPNPGWLSGMMATHL
jgi:hypothetical protein